MFSWPSGSNLRPNRFPATGSSSAWAAAVSAKSGSARPPAACTRPSSSSTATFAATRRHGDDGHRAEQELKALSRVKTVRHPYILSLERYDIIDGQLIIVMELADRNLWDRFKECRARGLPGIPRDELLRYMEEVGRGAGPDEQPVPAPTPRHQAAEPLSGPQPRQGRRLRLGQGPGGDAGVGHRRRHAGLRGPRNVRRLGQPLLRSIQPGHRLPGTADGTAAVHRHQHPPADHAALAGGAQRVAVAAGGSAGHCPRPGQEPATTAFRDLAWTWPARPRLAGGRATVPETGPTLDAVAPSRAASDRRHGRDAEPPSLAGSPRSPEQATASPPPP